MNVPQKNKDEITDILISSIEYMLLKKCNYEIDLPDTLNFDNIKNIEVFSKIGNIAIDISRDILKEVFTQIKIIEKERLLKGENNDTRNIKGRDDKSSKLKQNSNIGNSTMSENGILSRQLGSILSDNVDRKRGDVGENITLRDNVERIYPGKQQRFSNNIIDERDTIPENAGSTRNSELLRGGESERTTGEFTPTYNRKDIGESFSSITYIPDSEGANNKRSDRESEFSLISDTLEKEPLSNGSFYFQNQESIENLYEEELSIEYLDNELTEDFFVDINNIKSELNKNYVFSENDNLYNGGIKTRAQTNIQAIKLLKTLEDENRQATAEEQKILANYTGLGGLSVVLENKENFSTEYQTLKNLLNENEFKSAQKSTTTAFFTEHKIIQYMYQTLNNFGFESGKILDPSMGTGNFFSVLPEKMQNSKLYGVELDNITGRIAKQLYPNANISIQGFEETNYPNNFFDVAISNIPFNNLQINDPNYNKFNFKIHDYFIAKMIDNTRPNGIIGVIATKGVLDKKDSKLREFVYKKANLVGAIRLPNTAFKKVANTDVTTDIIFFQKREQALSEINKADKSARWLEITEDKNGIPINNYFIDNPNMLLGEMVFDKSMYGSEKLTACHPFPNTDFYELLDNAINNLHCEYKSQEITKEFDIENIEPIEKCE